MQTIVIFTFTVVVVILLASSLLSAISTFNKHDSNINSNNQFLLHTALAQSVIDTTSDISTNTTDTMNLSSNSIEEQDILRQGIIK
jgi:hypothetical protein